MGKAPFALVYAPELSDHLNAIDAKHHTLIWEKIEEQLQFEPNVETRNRKLLRAPTAFGASWEIRLGPGNRFRVLYDISEADRLVYVLAIGEKVRSRLHIGGREVEL